MLTVHAVDQGCGLDAKAFSFDNGRTFQISGRKVIQEPGEIKVLVRDALGNFSHGYITRPYRCVSWNGHGRNNLLPSRKDAIERRGKTV